MIFSQEMKEINRGTEIVQTLLKYGFEDFANNSPVKILIPKGKRIGWQKNEKLLIKHSRWELIRMLCEELGPTFVKLGQVLSNRNDILPDELITEFEKLQSNVAPFEYDTVKQIVESELGHTLEHLFQHFNKKPLASASIGQVHKAVLKEGGELVVVKVQRPDIRKTIETDLALLKRIVNQGEDYLENKFGITNAIEFVEEFERTMHKELKYNVEARNLRQFREYYKEEKNFYIPKMYKQFSTDKVLTLEYCSGCKITDIETLKEWGLDPHEIAETGMNVYMKQIFEHGYFHADPHPGNIIVQQDGTICLIDFGMVGRLMKRDKNAFAWALVSMARQDARSMARHFRKLSTQDNITNEKAFESDLNEIIEDFGMLDVSETNIAELGMRLQQVIHKYKMRVPPSLFLLLRALAILEGVGKTIHPSFNTYDYVKPYGKKLLKEVFSTENMIEEMGYRVSQFDYFVRNFPYDIKEILGSLRRGKLNMEINHQGYIPILDKFNNAANRMILAVLIVGLMLSSSIIMMADLPDSAKTASGIPTLSMGGFLIAGCLSLFLFFKMFRSKK